MGKNTSKHGGNESEAVGVTQRIAIHQETITVPTGTGATLASLLTPASTPDGAKACEIQADGGSIRIMMEGTVATAALGMRLDDGVSRLIDSSLDNVTVITEGGAALPANVVFFDRV